MGFDVSNEAANAVLFTVLTLFTILAFGAGGYLSFLPNRLTCFCRLRSEVEGNGPDPTSAADYFLSARNAAKPHEIALSYFAAGMGAWVRHLSLCGNDSLLSTKMRSCVLVTLTCFFYYSSHRLFMERPKWAPRLN